MKTPVYIAIAWRIIALMCIGMALTFVSPELRAFFGDTPFKPYPSPYNHYATITGEGYIDVYWIWGARHYWYFWGVFFLFILSLINFIMHIVNIVNKYYNSKNETSKS